MRAEEEMTIDERRKYLARMRSRYVTADREGKGTLLGEMEAVTGLHRKSLVRLMSGDLRRKVRTSQRSRVYGPDVR